MTVRARLHTNAGALAGRWRDRATGLDQALKRAADRTKRPLHEAVETRTPEKKGRLKRGLYVRVERHAGGWAVIAGFAGVPYARPIELGARPHVIRPRKKRALRFPAGGEIVFTQEVFHPGMPGRFMQRDGARATRPLFNRNIRAELRGLYLGR